MICKFCRQEKKLIKAHIIPRNFYLARKVDGKPQAQDDIDSLSIIPISVFIEKYNELLVDEHIVLGKMLVDFFRNNK